MHDSHDGRSGPGGPKHGRAAWLSFATAALIAVMLQFAAAAKVSAGADDLSRLEAVEMRERAGVRVDVTSAELVARYDYLLPPGALGIERGVLTDFAIAAAEFAVVVLLLLLHRRRSVWAVPALMFAAFGGFALHRLFNDAPCGCFGVLWEPPKGFSLVIDAVFVLLALVILAVRGAGVRGLGLVTGASVVAAAAGFVYSAQTYDGPPAGRETPAVETRPADPEPDLGTDADGDADPAIETESPADAPPADDEQGAAPDPAGGDPAGAEPEPSDDPDFSDLDVDAPASAYLERLPEMRGVLAGESASLGAYVFVWSTTCSTCEMMKPIVEAQAVSLEGMLDVVQLEKGRLNDRYGVPEWVWGTSPAVFVYEGGGLTAEFGGDETPFPEEVFGAIAAGEPVDGLR